MLKMVTTQISAEIYYSHVYHRFFPEGQTGYNGRAKGTNYLLYIGSYIPMKSKAERKNVGTAWIDYKKTYDMVEN